MTYAKPPIGWQPIETAPEIVRVYGPVREPEIGGCLVQLMMTEDAIVALGFGQNEGGRCPLKFWMTLPELPE